MKRLTLFVVLALFIQSGVSAQPCLPDSIFFATQAQIDSFQILHPNCTEIEGDVYISGNDITNLNGLNVLTSIGGSFNIWECGLLTNLTGLDNVTSIGDDLIIGYPDMPSGLTSLAGLEGLMSIGGDLRLSGNNSLTSLTGLDNLTFINGNFELGYPNMYFGGGNPSLTSLEGLGNLTSVGGQLSIFGNNSLTSLTGMDNIDISSIGDLDIIGNTSLSNCEAQWICDYLTNPSGTVNIYNNAIGCNNPPEIANACGITLPCLPDGNYYFHTQSQIDNFATNYPDCTILEGRVQIVGDSITNLNGLDNVNSIGGELWIGYNDALTSLTGLDNVNSIGGDLSIYNNDSLISLTGLDNVNSIGGDLSIHENDSLISLTGLDNVTSIGGEIYVASNDILTSLTGLDGLMSIGGDLTIYNNDSLISLTGLDNVTFIGGDLWITDNQNLSTCDVHSICNYLANPNGDISIYENASGCNYIGEVMQACQTVSLDEVHLSDKILIFPNPSSNQITIELPYTPQRNSFLTIYNINSQQLITRHITEQKTIVDVSGLPSGFYFVKVADENTVIVGKVVKK